MADYWSMSGTVEALGNSTFDRSGTRYSVLRLRGRDGRLQTLQDVIFPTNTHLDVQTGADLDMLGIKRKSRHLAFAVVRDGQVAEDISSLGKPKRMFLQMALIWLTAAAVFALLGPLILLAPLPGIIGGYHLLMFFQIPSETDMRSRLSEFLASRRVPAPPTVA